MANWFSKYVVPRVKFFRELTEQVYLLTILNDEVLKKEEEYLERTFPFRCPNCSSEMRIDKEDPEYDFCGSCGKGYMELFYGSQKIYKVDDGCVSWWVAATSDEEAVKEVIEYERAAGCDLIKEEYWNEDDIDNYAYTISIEDAKRTTFYSDGPGENNPTNIWEEFERDPSTRCMACSEW